MAEDRPEMDELGIRRRRSRKSTIKQFKPEKIARRVVEFAKEDEADRFDEQELRLQRYAKFRMWVEGGGDWPWEGSSDIGLPDMMTDVLALEDTLHNALMSNRPFTSARAIQKHDEGKQDIVDDLLDTQLFIEQRGEKAIEESADSFVKDGSFTAFIPWVREDRKMVTFRSFDGFGDDIPRSHFERIIQQEFPESVQIMLDAEGWDWKITDEFDHTFKAHFYTSDTDDIELIATRNTRVYDGPKVIIKDYEDVLAPARAANLQIPGPSNPNGASHVILIDYPTIDEIQRLVDSDFYDLVSKSDLKKIEAAEENRSDDEVKRQKDTMQGKSDRKHEEDPSHRTLTRYTCFDMYDVDGDGINTDMIWWVLKEPELLLKAKPMTEMYPSDPPRRPLAESAFIPVKGRRDGIGLLEMMESTHDFKKQILDQSVDAGTLANTPFGFYRPTSNIKPEVMRMWPGDMMPLQNPKEDVFFPNIGSGNSQSFALNMTALADQMQEKLTVRGDLQLGRVPVGRSSALRTSQNLQSLMQAGEARPERILRRFLMGWVEIMTQMYELDQHFLTDEKKFRIIGIRDPSDDPFRTVDAAKDLKGRFKLDFSVNVLNASKLAQQEALQAAIGMYVSELTMTLGIMTPEGAYRLFRDWGKTHGFMPEKYINQPSPEAMLPPILAEEALTAIIGGQMPAGPPMEGSRSHLNKLQQFAQSDQFGFIDSPSKVELFRSYLKNVSSRMKMEQMAKQAGEFGAAQGGNQGGQGGATESMAQPPVNENELLDETLPGAGGGANGGMQ